MPPRRPAIETTYQDTRPALVDPQELATVRAVLAGDRDAYRLLVERESEPVIRACTRILGDQHEAEDVAQEAFLIAYRRLGEWRSDGPFGAWLSRIAVRLALRRFGRRRSVTWIRPTDEDLSSADAGRSFNARISSDPLAAALVGERAATVRSAVADLEEPYREVVALRFFAERSLLEIADATGRPLATVKTHLRRGLLRLRAALVTGGPS
jgi:RNA polymerase sigma-70 factor (ECF subfamily)